MPHLNQPDQLRECLDALARQEGSFLLAEIIVVDNGSQVRPTEICGQIPCVTLLTEDEPGPGPARNAGVRASRGEILAFVDADCFARQDWFAAITHTFLARPDIDILGGSVVIPRSASQKPSALEAYESIYAYRNEEYITRHGFAGTGNLAIRRAVFDKVGPFGGIHISEDWDWGQRANQLGYRIHYLPEMAVYHPARSSFEELRKKWDRHIAHDYAAMQSKRFRRARMMLRAIAVALSPFAELPQIMTTKRVEGPRARWVALVCLTRIRLYRARRMLGLLITGDETSLLSNWNRG